MKKVFAAILIFVYCLTSFGFTVNKHYCMGEFVSWNINLHNHDEKCTNCGMHSKDDQKGCCHDEEKQIKLSDSQNNQISSIKVPTNFVIQLNPEFIDQIYSIQNATLNTQVDYRPPLHPEIPLFIRNCAYLI